MTFTVTAEGLPEMTAFARFDADDREWFVRVYLGTREDAERFETTTDAKLEDAVCRAVERLRNGT